MAKRKTIPKAVQGVSVKTSRVFAAIVGVIFLTLTSVGLAWSIIAGFVAYGVGILGFRKLWNHSGKRRKTMRKT